MRAGLLRESVTIYRSTVSVGSDRSVEDSWAPLFDCRASVNPRKGREFWNAKQVMSEIEHLVVIRYDSRVKARDRVYLGDRIFEIISPPVDPQNRHRELHLFCQEINP